MTESNQHHITVFLSAAVDALEVEPQQWYVDATFGRGGHTREILSRGGRVIAFDVDQEAIDYGADQLASELAAGNLILIRANFDQLKAQIDALRAEEQLGEIAGVLFDFGTSTNQLMSPARGFSFDSPTKLDMRMDQRLGVTAEDLLRVLSERQLSDIFRDLGGEREAKSVAKALKQYVSMYQTITAQDIAEVIAKTKHEPRGRLHPATKVFQALRMIVNSELDSIQQALPQALEIIKSQGRIVTIAFHEGEDRLAKHFFADWEKQGKGHRSPKEAITPDADELAHNPRSRSAKMRIFKLC